MLEARKIPVGVIKATVSEEFYAAIRGSCIPIEELNRRLRRLATALAKLPRWEIKRIWWFERRRYEAEGWLVRHPKGGFRPAVRPLAVRSVPPSQA